MSQTFKDFELIIVDDGSTDATSKIADNFAAQDIRIKVIHQENQWIYASFNNGIDTALGEYIYFLNSDDTFYDKYALEHLMEYVIEYNPDVVLTQVYLSRISEFGSLIGSSPFGKLDNIDSKIQFFRKDDMVQNYLGFWQSKLLSNQANLYKKSIFDKVKFRNDVYGADQLFNIDISDKINNLAVCDKIIYHYFSYESSDMNASSGQYYRYEHEMFNELYDKLSRYYSVFELLNKIQGTEKFSCYLIPAMCIKNYHNTGGKGVIKTTDSAIIPKIIHYMWLGGNPIPDRLQRCIESWKRYCPDYEIIQWNESNYDVHKNQFAAQAYDNKLYGFLPDYVRIELLYEYGGIYMDTDVELIRSPDDMLYQEAFCSVEKWQVLNFGGCSGSVKGHRALEPFMESWKRRSLFRSDGTIDKISSGLIDTAIALNAGYMINGITQSIMGMNIYTYDYFHPYDYMSGKLEKTSDTFSVHHFNGGWLDEKTKIDNMQATEMYEELMRSAEVVG